MFGRPPQQRGRGSRQAQSATAYGEANVTISGTKKEDRRKRSSLPFGPYPQNFLILRGSIVEPVVDIACRLIAGDAVPLLHFADQLIATSIELIDLVVGQLAPLFLDAAFQLRPFTLENV